MELFHENGHLTDEALSALIHQNSLDELQRLEIAEHLSFCDRCLQRYTERLSEIPLMEPPCSCQSSLFRRIRQRTIRLLTNRYATAAAAVALALTLLWGGDRLPAAFHQDSVPVSEATQPLPERWDNALSSLSGQLRNLLDSIELLPRSGGARTS